jgi:hypothetical protein
MPLLSLVALAVACSTSYAPCSTVAVAAHDTSAIGVASDPDVKSTSADSQALLPHGALDARLRFQLTDAADTVRRRARAVEVSDAYEMRLRIHRYASYTMVPLFALQSVAGNQLYQADKSGAEKPGWAKGTHVAGAVGLAGLFTINTVTGVWNLWESRSNETGRTKRWIHSILMLASDAAFTYSGISAGDAEESQSTRDHHRNVSYAGMASALVGYAVMLVGDH